MHRPSIRYLFAPGLAITLFAACSDTTAPDTATTADRSFINGMVPHHGMANLMADMAIARANRQELRNMATQMKQDQSREIDSLKARKLAWFGTDSVPSTMMPRDIPAGPNFDLEWMRMMVTHHQGAIDMSQLLIEANARVESDTLAQHIIEEQREEQQQMRAWAQQWYGATLQIERRR